MSDEAMVATNSREGDRLATRGDVERLTAQLGVAVHAMGDALAALGSGAAPPGAEAVGADGRERGRGGVRGLVGVANLIANLMAPARCVAIKTASERNSGC